MRTIILLICMAALIAFDIYVARSTKDAPHRAPEGYEEILVPDATPTKVKPVQAATRPAPAPSKPATKDVSKDVAGASSAKRSPLLDARSWPTPDMMNKDYVFSFFDKSDRSIFIQLAKARGFEIVDQIALGNSLRIRGGDMKSLERLLAEAPTPVDASPNYYVKTPEVFSKPPEVSQGSYKSFGTMALQWLGISGDYSAWGNGVTVAVLDTGIKRHPALSEARIVRFGDEVADSSARGDFDVHGTAVASLLAGGTSDMPGVAPSAKLLSIAVLGADGTGDAFTLAKGMMEAVDRGARIINLSLGTHSDCYLLKRAVEYAIQHGVAVVAAVGNDGLEGVLYPARYAGVVAVTAVDASGRRLSFANTGSEISISAPGLGLNAAGADEGTVYFSGTSASAPFVSGALAALLSQNPEMKTSEAIAILMKYANDTGAPGRDDSTGAGTLDIGRVMNRDMSGIVDVSICPPNLNPRHAADEDLVVTVYIQNRGTEVINRGKLNVTVDQLQNTFDYTNLAVGGTFSQDFRLAAQRLRQPGGVTMTYSVTIEGQEDINSTDNSGKSVFSLKPEPKTAAE